MTCLTSFITTSTRPVYSVWSNLLYLVLCQQWAGFFCHGGMFNNTQWHPNSEIWQVKRTEFINSVVRRWNPEDKPCARCLKNNLSSFFFFLSDLISNVETQILSPLDSSSVSFGAIVQLTFCWSHYFHPKKKGTTWCRSSKQTGEWINEWKRCCTLGLPLTEHSSLVL